MSVILGYGGYVQLSREWPEPTVFPQSSKTSQDAIFCREKAFWTGQHVYIYSHTGLPLKISNAQYAPCPAGHGFWGGGSLAQGPASNHRVNNASLFWRQGSAGDTYNPGTPSSPSGNFVYAGVPSNPSANFLVAQLSIPFWESEATTGFSQLTSAYIHRDQLDRISFYETEVGAINKDTGQLIEFSSVDYGCLLIAVYNSEISYEASIEALGEFMYGQFPTTESPVTSYVDLPSAISVVADDPEQRGWSMVAGCREWTLQTDPSVLDSTAIGEDFGDSVKDVVRGSGSFNSLIQASPGSLATFDPRSFIRLMLMTETGSKARARFRIQEQRNAGCDTEDSVWIECDILLGPGEIRTTVDDAVNYSAQFIVVKDKDGIGVRPMIGIFS